jgi:hypothetical protein
MGRETTRVVALAAGAALVVVLVVGSVANIGPASAPFHRTLAQGFAALATPIAARSNATGAELAATMSGVASTTRPLLFSALDRLAADAADESRQMDAAGSPPVVGGASQGCLSALTARAAGTAEVRDALEGYLGGPTGTSATAGDQPSALRLLGAAGTAMAGSDASWAACRAALLHQARGARVPKSVWVGDPATWDPGALGAFVSAVGRIRVLAAAPHLAVVALTTVPPVVVGGPGPGVLAPVFSTGCGCWTGSLVLRVVVANQGNVDEQGVRVAAGAATVGPGAPPGAAVGTTISVPVGLSQAVDLPPIAVKPGGTYTVLVTASDTAGGAPASATVTVTVAVPPPTTTTTTTAPPRSTTTVPGRTTTTTRHALSRPGPAG